MRIRILVQAAAAALAGLVLAACGGAGIGSTTDGTSGGTGGGTTGDATTGAVYRVGTLNGDTFTNGQIFVATPNLDAGGQTALRVDIVDQTGAPALGVSATVTFLSTCVGEGRAAIETASGGTTTGGSGATTTATGSASATYVAQGCVGSDTIIAQVAIDGGITITATGAVNVQAAQLGSIQFVSATPGVIGLSGSLVPNQSTVVFKVIDASGGPVPNQVVNFTLSTTVGGSSLTPAQATSNAQGIAQAVLQGGTAHATVSVIATVANTGGQTISKPSDPIAVTTGLPTSNGVSVSASRLSIDGTCDGEPTTVNVRLADRYGNPVPQNTAPTLVTDGGKINGSCVTGDPQGSPTTEAGVCSVLLAAQNPRPANGRVVVLAYVSGEESFVDTNGNGYFDAGEPFIDLPEAFEDNNENGVHDNGEFFFDANSNGNYDGPDGKFEGYVCDSPGVNCKTTLTTVSNSPPNSPLVIVFSTRQPVASDLQVSSSGTYVPSATLGAGMLTFNKPNQLASISVVVLDTNGNPLPSGTTYTFNSTSGTVLAPVTEGPFNTNSGSTAIAANHPSFTMQSAGTVATTAGANDGLASLTVNLPASACGGATAVTIPLFQVFGP